MKDGLRVLAASQPSTPMTPLLLKKYQDEGGAQSSGVLHPMKHLTPAGGHCNHFNWLLESTSTFA